MILTTITDQGAHVLSEKNCSLDNVEEVVVDGIDGKFRINLKQIRSSLATRTGLEPRVVHLVAGD